MAAPSQTGRAGRLAGPASLALLFAALVVWSWRKWTDVQIDFGNELYIAWRLSEGDALYGDIAHRNGPLSHYWNALLFAVFGVSLRTLVVANLALLAWICALVWQLFARACDRFTACVTVAVLLAGFGFGQYADIANFNYVTPYHHFQTHGLALSLAMLAALQSGARRGGRVPFAAAGACLGAVFLTKAELFVPALATAGLALRLRAAGMACAPRDAGHALPAFAVGCLGPLLGFALLLCAQLPWEIALRGLAGNWVHLSGSLADPFYRSGAGLDDPAGNALRALLALLALVAFAAFASAADRVGQALRRPALLAVLLAGSLLVVLLACATRLPWLHLARALPLTSLLAVLWLAGVRVRRAQGDDRERAVLALLGAVYAAALLAKLGLAARFHQYGFVLAMPATLVLVAAGVYGLPALLRARHGGGGVARALCVAVVVAWLAFLLGLSQRHYAAKRLELGRGGDAILAELPVLTPRPQRVAQTLRLLEERMPPGATLLVLPEGIGLNYWLRRENPTPFNLFLPTEIQAFGEDRMLAALEADPPDFVALLQRPAAEFGVGPFGRDPRNGLALRRFVDAHYRRIGGFGPEPFTGQGFGTLVLERALR